MTYGWAWGVWAVATAVVVACGWWLTRRWRPLVLRDLVRALAIATLVVPASAGEVDGFYAPAYIVLAFEALLQKDGDPGAAWVALIIAWTHALAIVAVIALLRHLRARREQHGRASG